MTLPSTHADYLVGIVVDPAFGDRLDALAARLPVWIADTEVNRAAAVRVWAAQPALGSTKPGAVTTFKVATRATPEAWCIDVLDDVAEHHAGYSGGEVYGTPASAALLELLARCGMSEITPVTGGFRATTPDGLPADDSGPFARAVALDLTHAPTLAALRALQQRSYAVEAELIGFAGMPGLTESLDDLRTCGEEFHGWVEDNILLGIISFKRQGAVLDIHRLAVDPTAFRRGVGRALLGFVLALPDVTEVVVGTAAANVPACRLYESSGFQVVARFTAEPGVALVRFALRRPG